MRTRPQQSTRARDELSNLATRNLNRRALLGLWLLTAPWAGAAGPGEPVLQSIDGTRHGTLDDGARVARVLFFVTNDCPISNQFAPEMNRICDEYKTQGVGCYLAYVDPYLTAADVKQHVTEFSHTCCPAILDSKHELVDRARATVTPEAAVFSRRGELAYRGRINNLYAGFGKRRRVATQHDLRDALDRVLAGQPVETPRTEAIGCFISKVGVSR